MSEQKEKSAKSRIWIVILLICITAAAIVIGLVVMNQKKNTEPLVPDYAPVEKEGNASPIEGDDEEKLDKPEGGGSVSISYSKEIQISLAEMKAAVYFANPARSNEDIVIQIVIQDHVIAQSGTISPGFEVRSLDLESSTKDLLVAGTYEGTLAIHYYDQQTNEKAILNTEIPVTVTVTE